MARTEWADVSEHNGQAADSRYKPPVIAFRAVDGTYLDHLFAANMKFARGAKSLFAILVYSVHPRSVGSSTWQETTAALVKALDGAIGAAHEPRLVLMDDVESWGRPELQRDYSHELEAKRAAEVLHLNLRRPKWQRGRLLGRYYRRRDSFRVIGYGNRSDLATMAGGASRVHWRAITLADYTPGAPTPKTYLGWRVIARQHTNGQEGDSPRGTAPFGPCDMNRAEIGPRQLARRLGLGRLRWTRR